MSLSIAAQAERTNGPAVHGASHATAPRAPIDDFHLPLSENETLQLVASLVNPSFGPVAQTAFDMNWTQQNILLLRCQWRALHLRTAHPRVITNFAPVLAAPTFAGIWVTRKDSAGRPHDPLLLRTSPHLALQNHLELSFRNLTAAEALLAMPAAEP
ncbi:hypothetical protein C8R47DRAFT_1222703 [Mycena vitilis]|nr:hypothetical protein C8R47DRAFT_1222703 [Mycena vitilis]